MSGEWILDYLETIPDFPKKGVNFISISPLLRNPEALHRVIGAFAKRYSARDVDLIVGVESRGFLFGSLLAYELALPFVMMRKAGKLPGEYVKIDYGLEYGKDSLELEVDSIKKGDQVVVVDDLLASGGTAQAACTLVEQIGGVVEEVAVIIELQDLDGRDMIQHPVHSLVDL